jgi:ElaB/YqjD/DUF883 family membrane-anchored ribosome-binding protein
MNAHLTAVESASQITLANQQTSTKHAQQHDNMLKELLESIDAMMVSNTSKSTTGKKNITNKHPALKVSESSPSSISTVR